MFLGLQYSPTNSSRQISYSILGPRNIHYLSMAWELSKIVTVCIPNQVQPCLSLPLIG